MTLPCPICYRTHQETRELSCACGGAVDCVGSESGARVVDGVAVAFQVSCIACGRLFSVDTRTGQRVGVQEPVLPGGAG